MDKTPERRGEDPVPDLGGVKAATAPSPWSCRPRKRWPLRAVKSVSNHWGLPDQIPVPATETTIQCSKERTS